MLQNTFNSVADAVIVLDANGKIILANEAAGRVLRYQPGMGVQDLRQMSVAYDAAGVIRLSADEMPSARALRGEPFDELEMVFHPVSGRPLRDAAGALGGAAVVYRDVTA